ncbi:Vesicle-associated membrane protein-associated protein A [Nosema granulosis]|uniref:Vesicle-associated membrane protein-associated protein A n=1 Tax=Nosema granulosis TaxID=83296 RepID=A0A9P6GZ31_9MICR|nr:Vesicle-associated membrane protein-associated protein A [Nosema granulosis]
MNDIQFEPSEVLKIHRGDKKTTISVRNMSMEGRAYKIKTTRPRDYIVKPSLGIIMPMEQVSIDVQLSDNCLPDDSHKFLIEIYEYDWKKPLSNLKSHLKMSKVVPLVTRKLGVSLFIEDFFENDSKSTEKDSLRSVIVCGLSSTYVVCMLLLLFLNIYNSEIC